MVVVALFAAAVITGATTTVSADDVEQRIAEFWRRIDALQPNDYVSASDLGQWAQNVIARDPRARLTVAEFRTSTAGMQSAIDRAGRAPAAATTPAPTPTPAPTAIVLKVGQSVTYTDGWKLTVLRTEPQAASRYSTPKPGFEFLAVIVRYENGTRSQAYFTKSYWKVQDGTGVRRGAAFVYEARSDELSSGYLAPGGFVQGSIVFEVPVGDARLSILYDEYGYLLATWQLY
jgi:hypothetical protein